MEKQEFIIKELNLLKEARGQILNKIIYVNPPFADIKLEFENYDLTVNNKIHSEKFLGNEDEDISYFTIDKLEKESDYKLQLDDWGISTLEVNEKIDSISIVNDLIIYNNEYEISYDVAIIFKTKKHEYIISRDWFYMETMEIGIDENIDEILDKDTIIEHYRGESKEIPVSINRTIKKIV